MSTKPCPFCGSEDIKVLPGSSLRFLVAECQQCGSQGPEVRIQEGTHEQADTMARLQAMAEWSYRVGGGE